jgi:hypothetical protein
MKPIEWIKDHAGHFASATAGGGAVFFVMFRDGLRELVQEWKSSRAEARAERLATRGARMAKEAGADKGMERLITLLEKDVEQQRSNMKEIIAVLGQMATSHERNLDAQRVFSNQMNDFDKRLGEVKTLAAVAARMQ